MYLELDREWTIIVELLMKFRVEQSETKQNEMVSWVKKVSKIYKTMIVMEKQKSTEPAMASTFRSLIECLSTGVYASLIQGPLSSVIEERETE